MNKYLRVFGLITLLMFSFYYTEQIGKFMQTKDPIYESIQTVASDYRLDPINAIIQENTIVPGLNGQQVNLEKSFRQMKNYGFFKESELVFDEVKPDVSASNHKDLIIKSGNPKKQAVALIVEDETIVSYLEEMGIFYSVLTTKETVENVRKFGMKINHDTLHYEEVEKSLQHQNQKSSYCFVTNSNFCNQKKKQKIKETISLNKGNFISQYKNITSGNIIYLQKNMDITHFQILVEFIYFRGLSIVSLDDLLNESRL